MVHGNLATGETPKFIGLVMGFARRLIALALTILSVSLWSGPAGAAFVIYTDLTSWQSDAASMGLSTALEDFNLFADGALPNFTVGPIGFNNSGGNHLTPPVQMLGGEIRTNGSNLNFVSDSLSGPALRGVGFDFADPLTGQLTLEVISSGGGSFFSTIVDRPETGISFIGFLFDFPALPQNIEIDAGTGATSFDNMRVAFVPLPAALLLFGSGLLALFGWAGIGRRRRTLEAA